MEIALSIKFKKFLAILLLVLFLVSLTAFVTSAKKDVPPIKPCKSQQKPICMEGKAFCNLITGQWKCNPIPCSEPQPTGCLRGAYCENGYWKCKCPGLVPRCVPGGYLAKCVNGKWKCDPCPPPKPTCPKGEPVCYENHWYCKV